MTTKGEIRGHAKLFGWTIHESSPFIDIYLLGENNIQVEYTTGGIVSSADRYRFYTVNDLHLMESASGQNKKSRVLSWLAELA